jgi:hypothetical protein
MIVSNKHKFIFLKNRKIAGSTFESLVSPHLGPADVCTGSPTDGTPRLNDKTGMGHMSCHEIKQRYPEQWDAYPKIAIERNPWDKCVSAFNWHSVIKPNLPGIAEQDFGLYLRSNAHLLPTDWALYADDNAPVVDVFQYGDMATLYSWMRTVIGIDIPDELWHNTKLKATARKHYTEYYKPADVDLVAELFHNEIRVFGYDYGTINQIDGVMKQRLKEKYNFTFHPQ